MTEAAETTEQPAGKGPRRPVQSIASLYDQAIERMLVSSERVSSAAEGKALLAKDEDTEAAADRVQRVVVFAVPVLRIVAKGAKFTRVPWVLVSSTAISIGIAVRSGVRELQIIGSLLAHRIETATTQPADPGLVKKLAVELYLAPKRVPDLSDRRLRFGRVVRRWAFRGAFGRTTGKAAEKALDAAERLDAALVAAQWAERDALQPGA